MISSENSSLNPTNFTMQALALRLAILINEDFIELDESDFVDYTPEEFHQVELNEVEDEEFLEEHEKETEE